MKARLYSELRRRSDAIWKRIFDHPFVRALYTGTLPLEKFKFYVVQDYNFLVAMMRVFSIMASKADPSAARKLLQVAYAEATTEMDNYVKLLSKLKLSLDYVVSAEPAPTNLAYTSFLISSCSLGGVAECLSAVLPCFASYREIALRYKRELESNPVELYKEWGSVYLSDEYASLVDSLVEIFEEQAQDNMLERYERLFRTASRYEYMFWDMADRVEEWPV